MLTLGVAVATGTAFLGEFMCHRGPVLLVEADMTRKLLQDRMIGADSTKHIAVLHTEPFDIVQFVKKGAIPDAMKRAQDLRPTLVMVDSLRKTSQQDEIDSKTPGLVYEAWRQLFPGATRLISHHDRKRPTNPQAFLNADEAARGTGAWLDDADAAMRLSRVAAQHEHKALLTFTKYRGEEPPEIHLRMNSELLLEPMKQSGKQALWAFRQAHPDADEHECRKFLLDSRLCRKSMAYRLVAEHFPLGSGK